MPPSPGCICASGVEPRPTASVTVEAPVKSRTSWTKSSTAPENPVPTILSTTAGARPPAIGVQPALPSAAPGLMLSILLPRQVRDTGIKAVTPRVWRPASQVSYDSSVGKDWGGGTGFAV